MLQRLLQNSSGQENKAVVSSREPAFDFEGILKQTQQRQQDAAISGRSSEAASKGDPATILKQVLTPSLSQDNIGNKGVNDWILECFKLQNILNNQFQMRVVETEGILHRMLKSLQDRKVFPDRAGVDPTYSTHPPASPANEGQPPGTAL